MRERERLLDVSPGQDLRQRIGTGNEEQLAARVELVEVAQGVDRVRRTGPVDVDPADREPRVGRRRDDGHQVPVLGGRDLTLGLLPGLAGGDEDDLVQLEVGLDLAGGDEVSVMDRVEGPAHHAEGPLAGHGQLCGRPLPKISVTTSSPTRVTKVKMPNAHLDMPTPSGLLSSSATINGSTSADDIARSLAVRIRPAIGWAHSPTRWSVLVVSACGCG